MATEPDSLRELGAQAPHGPNVTGKHVATATPNFAGADMNENEASVFQTILKPDDLYTEQGVYWADLPIAQKIGFVTSVDRKEAKRELATIGRMIKKDPLSPVGAYVRNMVIPGSGLLLEGYVLFSIGNVTPLLESAFPACWASKEICQKVWLQALTYMEVVGIIFGQIIVGLLGDWIGRRWGLIQDATIMFLGLVMLTAAWGTTQNGWVICYTWSLFLYGIGVGGEYPMTATSGMENAVGSGKLSTREDRLHRGRKTVSAFLMQGWGQFFNQVILILTLLMFNSGTGNPPYSEKVAQWTYRVSFAVPAVGTLWLVYFRIYKMKSASRVLDAAKKKSKVTGYDTQSLKLTFTYFGTRLIATAGAWYCNDVFFYGNKLFQNQFISVLTPGNKSVMVGWLYNLLNVGVSLFGYYLASFLVDNKLYGRKWMMVIGFMCDFVLFTIPAFDYGYYSKDGIHQFQVMYFLSSFFNQFGPNCVTFLAAAEVFPTPIRATAHGLSAAVGKLGALHASIMFNYITTTQKFHIVPWFGLLGAVLTLLFLPDTTGLDLKEQERRWNFIRSGRPNDYHGIAIHPHHLSWWERFRGIHKNYNPDLDYADKVEEMRSEWEEWQAAKAAEHDRQDLDDDDWSEQVSTYFTRTRTPGSTPYMPGREKQVSESEKQSSDSENDKAGLGEPAISNESKR